jgi:hypothetical protein
MEISETHKKLLIDMGIREEDFSLFDGKTVTYEFDANKGVRLYDPYYSTSYTEYIDVDGWSSWSTENRTPLPQTSCTKRKPKRSAGKN